ncbi:MAG TPA: Gfo/Idh/MocA family oxidoreductase [Gammaproteobacteria bacterium]|nr:Gfo/Idh/MocA family oxidoreductase [Gammaproteobacteria bacterium]
MVKIAVIGVGRWGQNHIRTVHQLGHLAVICSEHLEDSSRLAKEYDVLALSVEDMLAEDDIDGVIISTPAQTHAVIIEQCLMANKHVLTEKPMVLNYADATRLIQLAKIKNLHLMVGHLLCYHPAFDKVKDFINSDEFGESRLVQCTRLANGVIRSFENVFWDLAVHDISVLNGLYHQPLVVESVSFSEHDHSGRCDHGVIVLQVGSNIKAEIVVSWAHPYKRHECILYGSKGVLVFDDAKLIDDKISWIPHNQDSLIPFDFKAKQLISLDESLPLTRECQHFIDIIISGEESKTSARRELPVLKCLNDIQEKVNASMTLS